MSSTNRGGQRSPADVYNTPAWAVRRLLEHCSDLRGELWCDPCAGDGAIVRAVNEFDRHQAANLGLGVQRWKTFEIRPECEQPLLDLAAAPVIGDFLLTGSAISFAEVDVVITNPPYRLAMEFVEMCVPQTRVTAMLLRLNFLGSEKRGSFTRSFAPDVYVLPNRPSFAQNGKTDSIEYAWFVWKGAACRRRGQFMVLNSTPKSERLPPRAPRASKVQHKIVLVGP